MKCNFRLLFFFLLFSLVAPVSEYTAEQYIADVMSGRQVVCKWTRLAVERHLRDLKRAESGGPEFPYYFDEAQAKRAIDFKQQLRHTQGEWANPRLHDTRIRLEPWQQFIDWSLFGWRKIKGAYRRFTKSYISVGRKNGKTVDGASTANYCFLVDFPREIGPEAFFIATKREQARKAFDEAVRQIKKNPFLRDHTRYYKQNLTMTVPGTAALMRPLGKDSDTEDAWNPHFVLVDEYHAHPDSSMLAVMQSGTLARKQSLIFIITTAGFDKNCACYQEEHLLAEQILERPANLVVPENFFCIIYTLDEEDDWTDPKVWIKPNPNLGVSIGWEELEKEIKEALVSPRKQNYVKTKNMNIWTQAESRWITDEAWDACGFPVDPEELTGRKCYLGLDLSTAQDITAEVLCFPPVETGEPFKFLYRFFIPEENLIERERKDRVPYSRWIEDGFVFATPGATIDDDFVEQQIFKDAKKYRIEEIAFDPFKAQIFVNHLGDAGFTMVEMRQGFYTMSGPTDTFERKVLAREIAHGKHPVITWMISCTEVKSDNKGNFIPIKPDRRKSSRRIDGTVASIMSLGRAAINFEANPSKFVNDPTPKPPAAGMRNMDF